VQRDGSVAGEGACLMILEDGNAARARGAEVHGELFGYAAATGVPHDDVAVSTRVLAGCIRRALQESGCRPDEIDFVHLTGDATPAGDRIEVRAVLEAFGARGRDVPMTTIKSATGHLGNASGSVELAAMLESMRRGTLLPIVNLREPDPDLPACFVRSAIEGRRLRRGLMLSRGWPSHFTALVVGRGDG
jgi:3-oxoacyl-[acyl-carrier-protein] synthase II